MLLVCETIPDLILIRTRDSSQSKLLKLRRCTRMKHVFSFPITVFGTTPQDFQLSFIFMSLTMKKFMIGNGDSVTGIPIRIGILRCVDRDRVGIQSYALHHNWNKVHRIFVVKITKTHSSVIEWAWNWSVQLVVSKTWNTCTKLSSSYWNWHILTIHKHFLLWQPVYYNSIINFVILWEIKLRKSSEKFPESSERLFIQKN